MKKRISHPQLLIALPFILLIVVAFYAWVKDEVYEMVAVRDDVATQENSVEQVEESEDNPSGTNQPSTESIQARKDQVEPTTEVSKKLELDDALEEQVYFINDTTPNDSIYPQWYTDIISAPSGWDDSTGSNSTVVAIIDTGFALDHEDLVDAWLINDSEQGMTISTDSCWSGAPENKQTNNCDDDSNGYIDDWRGWDFSNDDNYAQAGENSVAGASHGTKSAGLVGARGDNNIGVASVNWQTKIMPLQGLFDEGYGFSTHLAGAVVYAVDNGADVINMSLGSSLPDSIMYAAIRYATDNNVIVVASAGNCGDEQSSSQCLGYPSPGGMGYPARYQETIAVGATTSTDVRAGFSSWGEELDIVAPGSGTIRTPTWTEANETTAYSTSAYGTSFSAPIVSGLASIIVGEFPELSKDEVLAILVTGADKVPSMGAADETDEYGWGRINVAQTINEIDSYRRQLLKAGGNISFLSSINPLVSSNRGHVSSSAITDSASAVTYCVSTPNTDCNLILRNGATVKNLGTRKTNKQGIVTWTWNKSDVGSSGTWNASTSSNSLTSNTEALLVQ